MLTFTQEIQRPFGTKWESLTWIILKFLFIACSWKNFQGINYHLLSTYFKLWFVKIRVDPSVSIFEWSLPKVASGVSVQVLQVPLEACHRKFLKVVAQNSYKKTIFGLLFFKGAGIASQTFGWLHFVECTRPWEVTICPSFLQHLIVEVHQKIRYRACSQGVSYSKHGAT